MSLSPDGDINARAIEFAQMQSLTPPLLPPAAPPVRRSRRRWWAFGCGGCGAIVLIVFLAAAVILINGVSNSPLRHFPAEAGASSVGDNFVVSAGGQNSETLVIDDPHALSDVEAFYQSALNTNGWMAQATDPSQAVSGDSWQFSRSASSAQFEVTFVTMGAITQITVQYATGGPVSSSTPTPQPLDSSVTALMLTPAEVTAAIPPHSASVTKYTDAEMNGQPGTDHRAFLANDGTPYADFGLVAYASSQAAARDYPNLVSSTCAATSTHPKIGTATQTDEFACSSGIFGITFQQGVIDCAIAAASASAVEDLARAESAKITRITGE